MGMYCVSGPVYLDTVMYIIKGSFFSEHYLHVHIHTINYIDGDCITMNY